MKTKPFNLEEALANPGRVACRDGVKPDDLYYFKTVREWRFTRPGSNVIYYACRDGFATLHGDDKDLLLTCETKLVPFDHTNCPVGRVVIPKTNPAARVLITGSGSEKAWVNGSMIPYTLLCEIYQFEDGTPCGVEVEE